MMHCCWRCPDVAVSASLIYSQVSKFPLSYMFGMCALFLVVCAACQRRLEQVVGHKDYEAVKVQAVADSA